MAKLREAEVLLGRGKKVAEVVKELEQENARLRKAVSNLTLDKPGVLGTQYQT
jgi:hypothetical protein